MTETTALHPGIAAIIETDTIHDSDYLHTPNKFYGVDFTIPAGVVRLAAEFSGRDESITLHRFSPNFILEWSVRFDGSTPISIVCSALEQALNF